MFLTKTSWITATLVFFVAVDFSAQCQLCVVSGLEPQRIFSGSESDVFAIFSNPTGQDCNLEIHTRLLQTSSSTAVFLTEKKWKQFEILAGQTVQEKAELSFPDVNAETRFLVQWLDETNRVVGKTEVLAYPTNLLCELNPLLGGEDLGVLDPNDIIKLQLKRQGVKYLNLGEMTLEDFHGKLAIFGPYKTKSQMHDGLSQTIQKIASKGVAVVWIQPPLTPKDELIPSFYTVPIGSGTVVVVQPNLIANFAENPRSQLNLVSLCRQALNPKVSVLPNFDVH